MSTRVFLRKFFVSDFEYKTYLQSESGKMQIMSWVFFRFVSECCESY